MASSLDDTGLVGPSQVAEPDALPSSPPPQIDPVAVGEVKVVGYDQRSQAVPVAADPA